MFKNMKKIYIREKDEYIKLGQALKKAGLVSSGDIAKEIIKDGKILVNDELETRRGRKLYKGDNFKFEEEIFLIDKV